MKGQQRSGAKMENSVKTTARRAALGAGSTCFQGDVIYNTTVHYASVSCVIQSELLQRRRTSSVGLVVFALIWNHDLAPDICCLTDTHTRAHTQQTLYSTHLLKEILAAVDSPLGGSCSERQKTQFLHIDGINTAKS